MPALNPPSMQIGGLPPGYAPGAAPGPPNLGLVTPLPLLVLQNVGAVTSVSGPTNITQNVNATRQGTLLVWIVAVNASAAAALGGVPTGWTLSASTTTATLALGVYTQRNNPGGLTSVTFSSNATATTGGIAAWFYEFLGVPLQPLVNAQAQNGSGTAVNGNGYNLSAGPNTQLFVSSLAWVAGPTLSSTSTSPGAAMNVNAVESSTAGTTNASLATAAGTTTGAPPLPSNLFFSGVISGAAVWCTGGFTLPTVMSMQVAFEPNAGLNVDQLGAVGMSAIGVSGWALGGGKPGSERQQ